jgi:hypothetical protein
MQNKSHLLSVHTRGDYEFRSFANGTVQVNLLLRDNESVPYDVLPVADARAFYKSL